MSFMSIALTPPIAWVSDKFGRKRLIPPAAALVACSLCLMPFAAAPQAFLGLVALYSVGMSAVPSTTQAFIADVSNDENRSQALAMLRSAGALASEPRWNSLHTPAALKGDLGMVFGASALGCVVVVPLPLVSPPAH